MKKVDLSENERNVLELIRENGSISLRSICKKLGKPSVNSASFLVHSLVKKGELEIRGKNTNKIYIPVKPYCLHPYNFGGRIFPQNFLERNGTY